MTNSMNKKDALAAFGAAPPDLSVISPFTRGGLALYVICGASTATKPGQQAGIMWHSIRWGMPHVLYELQGEQVLHVEKHGDHQPRSWCWPSGQNDAGGV